MGITNTLKELVHIYIKSKSKIKMTNKEQKLFSEIIDLNWGSARASTPSLMLELKLKLCKKQKQLKESMGDEAYDKFMNNGRKLFSEKED